METRPRSVAILFGTETGNSQDYAELVARRCRRLRMDEVRVSEMDGMSLSELLEFSVIIVVCSTTGQGELPRNSLKLWKQMLRKKLPPTFLSGIRFTTFGLGDSSYPRYNWAIRKIHKRFNQLGATELALRGEGDEQSTDAGGAEAHFDTWLNTVSEKLLDAFPLPDEIEQIPENELLSPRFTLEMEKSKPKRDGSLTKNLGMTRPHVSGGTVKSNNRITATDHFQDVRHLIFEPEHKDNNNDLSSYMYQPGDTIALYPQNNYDEVELLIKHQGWTDVADYPVTVNEAFKSSVPGGLVSPLTIRSLFLYHLDLNGIPRRSFFSMVWHFSQDNERECERLQEFCALDGLDDLYDYANRPRRSILETILEFDSIKIPIDYILDLFPPLRPRLFSIASPSPASPSSVSFELAIAIVKYKTILRRIRRGTCTRWVEALQESDRIPFSLHHSPIKMSSSSGIFIGPGTGVAPIRSMVLTHIRDKTKKMMLFFGCRNEAKDYIFKEDWENAIEKSPDSLQVIPAFSRDPPGKYVQNQLYTYREKLGDMIINEDSTIYVCGSSGAMPRQVRITMIEIIRLYLNSSEEEAQDYIRQMENKGRYIQDTW